MCVCEGVGKPIRTLSEIVLILILTPSLTIVYKDALLRSKIMEIGDKG